MQRRSMRAAAILFVSLGVFQAPASATDRKSYAGSECVKWGSTGTVQYSNSAIGNASTSGVLQVDCPVVKDANGAGTAWIHAIDRSSEAVECTLLEVWFLFNDSTIYSNSEGHASLGATTAVQELTYGGISSGTDSFTYFSCRIPPKSGTKVSYIETYSVNED